MSDKTQHKTVLGADCRITGELALDNDAVIMGQFKGTLRVRGVLELTESSFVSGMVIAGALRLAGNAEADVVAEHGVEMLSGASLTGQLFTSHLNIVEGATFQGQVCVGPNAVEAAGKVLRDQDTQLNDDEPAARATENPSLALQSEEEEIPTAAEEEDSDVTTLPSSIDSILRRRRAKVLSPAGHRVTAAPKGNPQAKAS
ncbi:MAG: polymer-forming cytoskeletal protein [Phycisphaeraceae bacterium]|nr:polymer-forming cytoskeletal protein [Phycisphaeraceae bacterium]